MCARLVSVVMPAYNAERFIRQAIDSVLNQTYPDVELIVVDDGSTDGTAAVALSYGDRLRYVRQENARQAAARNLGLSLAAGDLIAFLDADDAWLPEKLEKQVALWESRPELGLVGCSTRLIDEQGRALRDCRANLRGGCLRKILLREYEGAGVGSTALVPRGVFDAVGDFDPALPPCEDSDFLWRVASRYPLNFVDEPQVLYRQHGENSHRNLSRAAAGWLAISRKVFLDENVRRLSWVTRRRAHARLDYMLAGLYGQTRQWRRAVFHGLRAVLWWPPILLRLAAGASRQVVGGG